MRRLAAILTILCLVMAPAISEDIDPRLQAMGGVGIAVVGNNMQSFPNPAGVYFDNPDFTFAVRTSLSDTLGVKQLPYLPNANFSALFCGQMIAFDIGVDILADNYRPGTGNVDIYQTTAIAIALSAGYGNISAGLGISGGSMRQRIDVPMDTAYDNLMQFLFTNYDRVVNSEFLQVNAGFLYKNGNLSLGVLLDNILDKDGAKTTFNLNSLFAETGIGAYWASSEYSGRGKMNRLVYSYAFELDNLFSGASRIRMNTGAEFTFRLVRDFSISARAGFTSALSTLDEGTVTIGIGTHVRRTEFSFNVLVPLQAPVSARLTGTVLF